MSSIESIFVISNVEATIFHRSVYSLKINITLVSDRVRERIDGSSANITRLNDQPLVTKKSIALRIRETEFLNKFR